MVSVVQLVERQIVVLVVVGSSPTVHPKRKPTPKGRFSFCNVQRGFQLIFIFVRWRHKVSGAAFGLNCAACFEQPSGVFAGCGAVRQAKIFTFLQFIARANRRFTPHNCILPARWHQIAVI